MQHLTQSLPSIPPAARCSSDWVVHAIPLRQITGVALALLSLLALLAGGGLDRALAERIFRMEGGVDGFAWRNDYLLDVVLHQYGRIVVEVFLLAALVLLALSFLHARCRPYRTVTLYAVASVVTSIVAVVVLKQLTTPPCPWSVVQFGGDLQWQPWSNLLAISAPAGDCFPAGHVSGAFAWLGVGCLFPFTSRRYWLAILPVVLLGVVFAVSQDLRGAHLVTHDLATLLVCWLSASFWSRAFAPQARLRQVALK